MPLPPELRRRPLRGGVRIASSLLRLAARRTDVWVRYDGGRSRLLADLTTPLGLYVYRYGVSDADIERFGAALREGDVVVDGGANVGLYTLVAAARVGPSGRVLAFEPAPAVREVLRRNVERNGFGNVDVLPWALGAAPGSAEFFVSSYGGGESSFAPADAAGWEAVRVEVRRLDDCVPDDLLPRLRFVKLDLEGAELAALQGAERVLRAGPDFLVEVERALLARQGATPEQVAGAFAAHGYEAEPSATGPNVRYRRR